MPRTHPSFLTPTVGTVSVLYSCATMYTKVVYSSSKVPHGLSISRSSPVHPVPRSKVSPTRSSISWLQPLVFHSLGRGQAPPPTRASIVCHFHSVPVVVSSLFVIRFSLFALVYPTYVQHNNRLFIFDYPGRQPSRIRGIKGSSHTVASSPTHEIE